MNVGIIIICYNISTEIFLLQIEAIRKFCKDEFEIQVIDNSSDLDIAKDLLYHSNILGVSYLKTFSDSRNSSDSHSFASNFAYQKFKDSYEYLVFIEHDVIPVKPFSIVEILSGGHVMAGLGQGALKTYFWPGIVMWGTDRVEKSIIDFSPSIEFRLDTGGSLYKVVDKYGKENCIFFNEGYYQNPYFSSNEYNHYAMINDGMFMHFVASSNWIGLGRHEERINSLLNIAREKINLYNDENGKKP